MSLELDKIKKQLSGVLSELEKEKKRYDKFSKDKGRYIKSDSNKNKVQEILNLYSKMILYRDRLLNSLFITTNKGERITIEDKLKKLDSTIGEIVLPNLEQLTKKINAGLDHTNKKVGKKLATTPVKKEPEFKKVLKVVHH